MTCVTGGARIIARLTRPRENAGCRQFPIRSSGNRLPAIRLGVAEITARPKPHRNALFVTLGRRTGAPEDDAWPLTAIPPSDDRRSVARRRIHFSPPASHGLNHPAQENRRGEGGPRGETHHAGAGTGETRVQAACFRSFFGGKSVADSGLPSVSAISSSLPLRHSGTPPPLIHESTVETGHPV